MGSGILVLNQPGVYLVDADGNVITVADGDTIANQEALLLAGKDGSNARLVVVDSSGKVAIQNPSNLDVLLSTRATEATLASADGRLTTIDAVLDSIKDTDGIKKITDALPVGDNIVGRVKVTDGTSVADILDDGGVKHLAAGKNNKVDANNSSTSQLGVDGTFVGSATDVSEYASVAITVHSDKDSAVDGMKFEFSMDGTNWDDSYSFNLEADSSQTRRFQFPVCAQYFRFNYTNGSETTTEFRCQTILNRNNILTSIHRIESLTKEDRSAQLVKAALIAQREGATITDFYPVQADISGNLKVTTIGTDVPSDPSQLVLEFCKNGGSENLLVDGSVTPVNFDVGPTVTDEVWSLREVLLTFAADDFSFDGASFGPNAKMTNGLDIEIVQDGTPVSIFTVYQNEDFLRLPGRTPLVNNTGPKDILGAAIAFQGLVLNQSTGDVVRVKVQDNLTSVKFQYLTATIFAVKVV